MLQVLAVPGVYVTGPRCTVCVCYRSWLYWVCMLQVLAVPCVYVTGPGCTGCVCYRSWLYQVCRGVDNEPVKPRRLAKSIGCGKVFPGTELLDTEEKVTA